MLYGVYRWHTHWRLHNTNWIDTIYACQDKSGDIKMGIRSTAILFGSWIRPFLVTSAAAFLSMLAIAGYLNEQGAIYYVLSVGGTGVHLVWQLFTVDPDDQSSCWGMWLEFLRCDRYLLGEAIFNSNGQLGQIVWTGLMLDYLGKLGLVPCCFMDNV